MVLVHTSTCMYWISKLRVWTCHQTNWPESQKVLVCGETVWGRFEQAAPGWPPNDDQHTDFGELSTSSLIPAILWPRLSWAAAQDSDHLNEIGRIEWPSKYWLLIEFTWGFRCLHWTQPFCFAQSTSPSCTIQHWSTTISEPIWKYLWKQNLYSHYSTAPRAEQG